jgi:hypothetical protein
LLPPNSAAAERAVGNLHIFQEQLGKPPGRFRGNSAGAQECFIENSFLPLSSNTKDLTLKVLLNAELSLVKDLISATRK